MAAAAGVPAAAVSVPRAVAGMSSMAFGRSGVARAIAGLTAVRMAATGVPRVAGAVAASWRSVARAVASLAAVRVTTGWCSVTGAVASLVTVRVTVRVTAAVGVAAAGEAAVFISIFTAEDRQRVEHHHEHRANVGDNRQPERGVTSDCEPEHDGLADQREQNVLTDLPQAELQRKRSCQQSDTSPHA